MSVRFAKIIAKISALSSGKFDKYEYHKVEEILPYNQWNIREQMKFTFPPLGRIFENQAKKQVDTLKSFNLSNKINEFNEIKLYFHKIKQLIQFLIAEKESHNYKMILN